MEELEIYIHTSHDGNEIRKVSFEVLNERPQNVSKKGYTFYNDNPLDELGVGLFIYNGTNWVNVFTEYEHFKRTDNVVDFDIDIDNTINPNNTISIIKKLTITDEGHIKDIEFIDIDYNHVGAAKAMHTHNTEDIIFNSPDRLLGSANDGATFELSADNVLTFLSIAKGEIGDLINYNQLDSQHRVWTASTIIEYVSSVVGQQITGALIYQNTGYIGQNDPGTLILPIPEGGATIPIDKGMVWVVSTDGFFGTERVEGGDMIIALVDNATNDDDFQVINKNITLVAATSLISGLVKLFSDTIQTEDANDVTSTSGRTYGIQANSSGQLVVNVPWTDTTYTTDTLGILNDGQSTSGALQSSKNLNDWLFGKGFLTNVNLIGYATEAWVLSQNYVNVNTVTQVGTTSANMSSGDILIVGGGSASVSKSGNTITISSTDTNTTYTGSTSISLVSGSFQRAALTGDVTAAQNSNATTIANNAVTFTKMQNIATQRLLGRGAAGTGNIEELTLGSGLSLSTAGVLSATGSGGTVTSVAMSVPTGLTVTGSPITSSGTLTLGFASGYSLPTISKQEDWDTAFNKTIKAVAVTGTTTKTITLTREDDTVLTANWTDYSADTITKLRGTTTGTYTSGDLTLLAGTNVTISQSGSNFTIGSTDTTYTGGTGISISGTTINNTAPNITQVLSLSGNILTLSNGGSSVTLPSATRVGTTSGNVTSGDILIVGGGSASVSKSGNTITITGTNSTYTAGTGITLTGTTFSHTAHTGDVTGSTALTITNNAVTFAKMQNIATQRILGRGTTGAGNIEELTLGTGLSLSTTGILSATGSGGTVTSVGLTIAGNALNTNLATITSSGTFGLTWAGTTAQYIRGDGSLATMPTIPTVGNGSLSIGTPTGLTTTGTFTANQSGNSTITLAYDTGYQGYTTTEATKLAGIEANANNYILPTATDAVLGGVKLFSNTNQTVAANTITTTASRTYGIQTNASGQLVVNVPWENTNTNTTYSGSTSIILSGTSFQRAALTGDITASQNSNATTIANNAVTFAKMQNIATQRLLGRGTAGSGNIEELTLGSGLVLSTTGVLSATGSGGTVSSVGLTIAGNALNTNTATITSSGTFGLTWGGTAAQYVNGQGTLVTFPTLPTVGNGSLTIGTPTGLSSSGTFTANQSGNSTISLAYTTGYQGYTTAEATKLAGIEANANNYTLPTATDTVLGGVKLFSDTVQTVAANTITTTASRTYGIQTNASGQLVVNVPWVDNNTNTTYSGSTSIILSGTSFQRAALTGDITSAQNSNTTTIANNVVTFTKMQNISTQTILGRYDSGTGNVQEITLGSGLSLSTTGVLSSTSVGGTVTSVAMSVPTGLTVSGSPITSSGTLAVGFASGYSLPTTAKQGQWDAAYGWGNHAGLYSLLNHTHVTSNITALTGYTLGTNTALTATMSLNTALGNLQAQINAKTNNSGTVTSVGMTIAGNALTTNTATITSSGTFGLTWGGTAAQYVNGQGALVTFPTIPTVNNGQLTLSTGTGLTGSATFTANQSGSSTFSVSVANTHKLPTTAEWNALPTTDTITRLRGTSSGTFTSGDLTLLAGTNTTITQSGSNITIASTNTNTTYSAGAGLTLSGTTFSLPITYSGTGDYVSAITQTTNGLTVTRSTLPTFTDAITSISRNGVNIPISSQNVDIPVFSTTGAGLVPARVGSVATKYLREDGTWVTPSNTTYSNMAIAELNTGTVATGRIISASVLNQWLNGKGFSTQTLTAGSNITISGSTISATNTTYSAGTGLSLSGTAFGQTITTSGTGTFVTGITQTTNGFQVNLGTPPNTNTTYSAGTLALLQAGTDATNRVWRADHLNQGIKALTYNPGNLTFGSGLNYNASTGVLTTASQDSIFAYSPQGGLYTTDWSSTALGQHSVAIGYTSVVTASSSISIGKGVFTGGAMSQNIGFSSNVNNSTSSNFGSYNLNSGIMSNTYGQGLISRGMGLTVIGKYNQLFDHQENMDVDTKTAAIQFGVGKDELTRRNAITIYNDRRMDYDSQRDDSTWNRNTIPDIKWIQENISSGGGNPFYLRANSSSWLSGNVSLVAGNNITLSQSGNNITINSTGGGGGTGGAATHIYTDGVTEMHDFNGVPANGLVSEYGLVVEPPLLDNMYGQVGVWVLGTNGSYVEPNFSNIYGQIGVNINGGVIVNQGVIGADNRRIDIPSMKDATYLILTLDKKGNTRLSWLNADEIRSERNNSDNHEVIFIGQIYDYEGKPYFNVNPQII